MLINSYESRFIPVRFLNFRHDVLSDIFIFDRKKLDLLSFPDTKQLPQYVKNNPFSGGIFAYPSHSAMSLAVRAFPHELMPTSSLTRVSGHALDSAWTAGSAGDGSGSRFYCVDDISITKVYFYTHSFTGTAANVNDVDIEIRSETGTYQIDTSGPGLLGSATVVPSTTANRHNGYTSFNVALTKDLMYFVLIVDPDGNTTDYISISTEISGNTMLANTGIIYTHMGIGTTNGGTTYGVNTASGLLIFFSDGTILGSPAFATSSPSSSATRGMKIKNGFTFPIKPRALIGIGSSPGTSISGAQIWTGTTGPSGTPFLSSSQFVKQNNDSSRYAGYYFSNPGIIENLTSFRAVFTYSGSVGNLAKLTVSPTGNTDLQSALPGGGNFVWTESSGGSWADDNDSISTITLMVDEIGYITSPLPLRVYPAVPDERTYPTYGV